MRRALVAAAASAVLVPTLAATTAAADSPVQSGEPKPQRLLVISLPMLAWKDANDHRLPNLNRLLDESAVADLTTRTISRETKLADGYITLGAGTRSIGAGTDVDGEGFEVGEPFGADNAGQVFERRTGRTSRSGLVDLGIGRIQDRNKQELFDAEIGALGDALAGAGWSRAVIANGDGLDVEDVTGGYYRRQAVAGLMGSDGKVPTGVVGPSSIGNYLATLGIPATAGFGVTFNG